MSPLENAIQEQLGLTNKGYSVEQIQCAALMLIAAYLQPKILVQGELHDGAD
jgi:hypothetical protein